MSECYMERCIMELTVVFLLAGCVNVLGGTVASICKSKERFLSCGGCQKTCDDPEPACTAVCREGCYCPEGLVRNRFGDCIQLSECPSKGTDIYETESSELILKECPIDEEYRSCEPCIKTCANPNPICPAQCERGCFCKGTKVRNGDGKCVEPEDCGTEPAEPSYSDAVLIENVCGSNEVFKTCGCVQSCSTPYVDCEMTCERGCFCEEGYIMSDGGSCVEHDACD